MWITPAKGYLTQPASIRWEQNKHNIRYGGRPLSSNELKPLGYLATDCRLQIIKVTYTPNKTPIWPRTDWKLNHGGSWLAPNRTY